MYLKNELEFYQLVDTNNLLLLTLAVDKGFESSIEEGCDVYYSRGILGTVKLVIVASVTINLC